MSIKRSLKSLNKWEIEMVLEHCGVEREKIENVKFTMDCVKNAFDGLCDGEELTEDSYCKLTTDIIKHRWSDAINCKSDFRIYRRVDDEGYTKVRVEWY